MGRNDSGDSKLAGDLDEVEESPFLRRRKSVAVRRNRLSRRIWRIAGWALFLLLAFLPAGVGGFALARYVLRSPRFELNSPHDVQVYGNHFVTRDEVLNVLGVTTTPAFPAEINIFGISLVAKERQVESLAWVRSAKVVRACPHLLAVYLTERKPVAFVDLDGHIKLIDAEGVILDKPDKGAFDFPVLEGLNNQMGAEGLRMRLALYQEFENQTTGELPRSGWMVSEVDLGDLDDLKALLVQGRTTLVLHFGHQDFGDRFRNFLTLLPELQKGSTAIDSIDLRYGNQVVVDPARPEKSGTKSSEHGKGVR